VIGDYSLWLEPAPGPVRQRLCALIGDLQSQVHGAPLVPHLTLVPSLGSNWCKALRVANAIVAHLAAQRASIRPFVNCRGTMVGSHRYQSVMCHIVPEPWLMRLNRHAQQLLRTPRVLYVPHISLVYADLSVACCAELIRGIGPLPSRIPVGRLSLYRVLTGIESRRRCWSWALPIHGQSPRG